MKFIVNEISTNNGVILVVTDKELIGKKLSNDKIDIDLSIKFFQGCEFDKKKIIDKIKCSYILHFTGKESLKILKELNLVDNNKIMIIQDIPHAEVYMG
ncbi:DUF424 family protein [archaeon]|jgi:hypothetical protein|nr:DUF424 family protein [archaeon]MBT3450977.1 DUF424 family protein [archaeon]MBT6868603.1 DUF424 family protein [archaeon]MBT7193135.1 DUF424 family protein [archaeon]MBT7381115.1 DUF424 family protein [archaeon]